MGFPDSQAIILFVFYIAILGLLYLIWQGPGKRLQFNPLRIFRKRDSQFEHQLLQEFVSACTVVSGVENTLNVIASHATSFLGADNWLIAASLENRNVLISSNGLESADHEALYVADLAQWLHNNPYPMATTFEKRHELSSLAEQLSISFHTPALLLPLLAGSKLSGFALFWSKNRAVTHRSFQFLKLFLATANEFVLKAVVEEEQLAQREQQLQAEKMAALGNLASAVAHEIRNPLTFIRAATEQIGENRNLTNDEKKLVDGILEESDRINGRIQQLLSLARPDTTTFELIDLKAAVENSLDLAEPGLSVNNIALRRKMVEEECLVKANGEQLGQVFLNLCLNAAQAIASEGSIAVELSTGDGHAIIDFIDNGSGIEEQHQKHLFEPFFTTKDTGTGLGLATSYRILQAHSGSLTLESTSREGTHFQIRLPLANEDHE